MNSGESAMPTTVSVRRRLLMIAVSDRPGRRRCAAAKDSETKELRAGPRTIPATPITMSSEPAGGRPASTLSAPTPARRRLVCRAGPRRRCAARRRRRRARRRDAGRPRAARASTNEHVAEALLLVRTARGTATASRDCTSPAPRPQPPQRPRPQSPPPGSAGGRGRERARGQRLHGLTIADRVRQPWWRCDGSS